ncbi:MAG: hypothetical protein ABW187_02695 [Dokdonella sp.]
MPAVFTLFTAVALAAAPKPPPRAPATLFPGLTHLALKQEGVHVWYPQAQATPVKAPAAYLKAYEEAGVYATQPLTLDLGHGVPTATLTCDSGPSADPSCRLLADPDNPDSTLFESSGIDFVFLANAEIYVYGQSDTLYDHRRLFRFDGKHYVEAKQAFRYVGIEGVTKSTLAVTAEKGADAGHALVTLPAHTPLTILLNPPNENEDGENPDYLVKTREGLVGWAHIPTQPDGKTSVEGLYFAGD